MEIGAELQPKIRRVAGLRASVNNPGSFGQSARSRPIEFLLLTAEPYEQLDGYVQRFLEAISENPNLVNMDSDLKLNKPQIEIELDRDRIADIGAGVLTVGRTIETLLGGRQVTRFNMNGEQYDVLVQVAATDRRTPDDLQDIYVRGQNGGMVQLSNLMRVEETVSPKALNRFNQLRAARVTGNLAPGYTLGEALEYLEQTAHDVLPGSVRHDYGGISREFKQAGASLLFIFVLALGFIYLVLSAQFESFIDPFIIMLTVPLSMFGALAAIHLTDGTLNIYSQIGLVTLIGLITKHGILIVQFANRLQDEGLALHDAVVRAAALRLRPILMTTGAMVSGAIPLALAGGAGAESRQAIGWVIVGGMTFGTVLTLLVVPTAYTLFARDRSRPAGEEAAAPTPAE